MTPTRAREIEWDSIRIGGQPHSHICPMCAAMVPMANDYAGVAFRERHIRWQEGAAVQTVARIAREEVSCD